MNYLSPLIKSFEAHANETNAVPMAKYMKNRFEYLGLKSPQRRELQKQFLKSYGLPDISDVTNVVKELWSKTEREYQYFALDLLDKMKNKLPKETIDLYVYLITTKSWWDTVDLIAGKLIGNHLVKFPELIELTETWAVHENMWLRRTALLYQLKYKSNTDEKRLSKFIELNMGSSEFFINKAIGWILREYGKTNPKFVIDFVETHDDLSSLSKKEAMRRITK